MFHRNDKDERPPYLRWLLFKQPTSATGDWWDRRDRQLAHLAPIRYWLNNVPPRWLNIQQRKLKDMKFWVIHRTSDKYHIINTRLKPGYYELDERMLHGMFSLLVDYVEVGLASRNFDCRFVIPAQRGLNHLEWEMTDSQCAGDQADAAKIVHDLYQWWAVERPARRDPWADPLIWGKADAETPVPKKRRRFKRMAYKAGQGLFSSRSPARKQAGELSTTLQEFYSLQDQAMLERLAKVRPSLWT